MEVFPTSFNEFLPYYTGRNMTYQLLNKVPEVIFRAYDIRGTVEDFLTPDVVYTIAMAIGSEARENSENNFVIARDGRLSGTQLIDALQKGLRDSGCNVMDIGVVPSPVLYFATHILPYQSGIVLTGSHNPKNYNGLKIIINGETLSEERIKKIYKRILLQNFTKGDGYYESINIIPNYIVRICQDVKLHRRLRVVVDCGNGVAGNVAPLLFKHLNCEVIPLFCEVDGNFPNHHPDPSVPENLQDLIDKVKSSEADLGIAFDGDGDRLGVVTNTGEIIWPDRQMILFSMDILKRNPGASIIYDVKCSRFLEKMIRDQNGNPVMWKTGHSLIKNKLKETDALLAGEMSGHIFFKERWYGFDDGLYAAARLLEILSNDMRTCQEIFSDFPESVNTPELKALIADDDKFIFMENFKNNAQFKDANINMIDGVRVEFDYGWGLIRPSNTTPALVLRFEADTEHNLKRIQNDFRTQILAVNNELVLPF